MDTFSSDSGEELHRLYRQLGPTPGSYGGRFRPSSGAEPPTLDEMIAGVAELPLAYELPETEVCEVRPATSGFALS